MVGEGTRGGRERRREGREQGDGGRGNKEREGETEGGRERVRGGREEARMLHRHEASVEEGRVEGGRVDDGNKRGRNGGREEASGGQLRAGEGLREERMEQGSKEMKLQGRYPEYTVYSHPIPQRARAIATLLFQMKNSEHV